jgi:hypothetical protein
MTTYRLITTNPLKLVTKNVSGKPAIMQVKDGYPAPTPPVIWKDYWPAPEDWPTDIKQPPLYAYVEELTYPEEAPAEGFIWSRKLTVDAYGWEQVVAPDDKIEPEWYEVPAWRVRAIATVTPYEDGLLIDAITVAINSIVDPLEKVTAQEVFFGGNTLHRTSTLLVTMAAGLGLSDNQLDDLFQQAYAIVV